MSIVKCFECGEGISNGAKVCPHCGYKGYDGYWLEAGRTAEFAAKFSSRKEANEALSKKKDKIMEQVRFSNCNMGKR